MKPQTLALTSKDVVKQQIICCAYTHEKHQHRMVKDARKVARIVTCPPRGLHQVLNHELSLLSAIKILLDGSYHLIADLGRFFEPGFEVLLNRLEFL